MSPLGVEAEITAFLTKHNLDGARFCRLVGPVISTTKLSAALNGLRSLDFEQTAAARKLMSAIDQLVELCCPLPISLRDPQLIKQLLAAMEAGELRVQVEVSSVSFVGAA